MVVSLCDHGQAPAEFIPILIKAGVSPDEFKDKVTPLIAVRIRAASAGCRFIHRFAAVNMLETGRGADQGKRTIKVLQGKDLRQLMSQNETHQFPQVIRG